MSIGVRNRGLGIVLFVVHYVKVRNVETVIGEKRLRPFIKRKMIEIIKMAGGYIMVIGGYVLAHALLLRSCKRMYIQ